MKTTKKYCQTHITIANVTFLINDLVDIVIKYIGKDPFDCYEGKFLHHINSKMLELEFPNGIMAYNNEIYVCNSVKNKIEIMDSNGTNITEWQNNNNPFSYPADIIIYNSEFYVSNYHNNTIEIFSLPHKHLVRKIYCKRSVWSIRIYKSRIYTSCSGLVPISVYSLEGVFLQEFYNHGDHCSGAHGICVNNDNIYICSTYNNKIVCMSLNGDYKFHWGENNLTDPYNIHVFTDSEDDVCEFMYINDTIGLHKYNINGNLIKSWPFNNQDVGQSSNFCFLNGKCFVTQWSNGRISVFE